MENGLLDRRDSLDLLQDLDFGVIDLGLPEVEDGAKSIRRGPSEDVERRHTESETVDAVDAERGRGSVVGVPVRNGGLSQGEVGGRLRDGAPAAVGPARRGEESDHEIDVRSGRGEFKVSTGFSNVQLDSTLLLVRPSEVVL